MEGINLNQGAGCEERIENNQEKILESGFERCEELNQLLAEIEDMAPNERKEFSLPVNVDYRYFISELGRPDRNFEFGGICNPRTGSIVIIRGVAPEGPFAVANAEIPSLRRRKDGETEDIPFHTHPIFRENRRLAKRDHKPEDFCKASNGDIDSIMAFRAVEEDEGLSRKITQITSSNGYIGILESDGIRLDDNRLQEAGVSPEQLNKIKELLAIIPPIWIKNLAKNSESEAPLVKLVEEFYCRRKIDTQISFAKRVRELASMARPYMIDEKNKNKYDDGEKIKKKMKSFTDGIENNFPHYPGGGYLNNIGLDDQQATLVREMMGVKETIFKVVEGIGLEKIERKTERNNL
ncbi:MAG: hypothetical protein MUD10_00600 [Candidatus Pacebacteria bacterium]|jgi:hypothetical protein|nr:hypothetical protein [Candidatus Paceibacterota bacterium]